VWLVHHLEQLGLSSPHDLNLLEDEDLLPTDLDSITKQELARNYPREITLPDAKYQVSYDSIQRCATLKQIAGRRSTPPPAHQLPRLKGWRILLDHKNRIRTIRQ